VDVHLELHADLDRGVGGERIGRRCIPKDVERPDAGGGERPAHRRGHGVAGVDGCAADGGGVEGALNEVGGGGEGGGVGGGVVAGGAGDDVVARIAQHEGDGPGLHVLAEGGGWLGED